MLVRRCSGLVLLGLFRSLSNLENTAQVYFFDAWLEKTKFGVTSRSLGSRKLGSTSLRGRENCRKLNSKSLRGREKSEKLGSKNLRGRENFRKLDSELL